MKKRNQLKRIHKGATPSVIALLTDFGERDHYVGTMKGVILSINPLVRIIDISHNVAPQNIQEAGYLLWASYKYFPAGTVFTCVVDPGVGTNRKIICLETARYRFIAPDNGLLDFVILQEQILESYELADPPPFVLGSVSATFHGRDIFAPLAALLTSGKSMRTFGKTFALKQPHPVWYDSESGLTGAQILHADQFGNLVTNIPARFFDQCNLRVGSIEVSEHVHSYAEAPEGVACMLVGSSGLIEIAVNGGSALRTINADLRTSLKVFKRSEMKAR